MIKVNNLHCKIIVIQWQNIVTKLIIYSNSFKKKNYQIKRKCHCIAWPFSLKEIVDPRSDPYLRFKIVKPITNTLRLNSRSIPACFQLFFFFTLSESYPKWKWRLTKPPISPPSPSSLLLTFIPGYFTFSDSETPCVIYFFHI